MPLFPSFSNLFGTPPVEDRPDAETKQDKDDEAALTAAAVSMDPLHAKARQVNDVAAQSRTVIQNLHQPTNLDRTLSHTVLQLPENLPNRADIHQDTLEWELHVALGLTDPVKLHQRILDIELAIMAVDARMSYGRLHSRLALTAFYADVCDRTTVMKLGPGLPSSSSVPTFDISQWEQNRLSLIELRRNLLRKDANVVVPVQVMARRSSLGTQTKEDGDDETMEHCDRETEHSPPSPPENSDIDRQLEKHPMMQADYHEVLQLFWLQEILADLQSALQAIQKARPRDVKVKVKAALQAYNESLARVFEGSHVVPAQLVFTSSIGGQKQSTLVASLLQAIQNVCLNDDNSYSYAQLQQKTRSLLTKWSESILEIPTLYALGYGGVVPPVVEQQDGDDDVSSFGQAEDAPLETQAPDPLPFRRSKYAHSPAKGPGFGSSPDEQVVLEQLSRGSSGSPLRQGELLMQTHVPAQQQPNTSTHDDFQMNQDDDITDNEEELVPPPKKVRSVIKKQQSREASDKIRLYGDDDDLTDTVQPTKQSKSSSAPKRKDRVEPDLWADSDDDSSRKESQKKKRGRTKNFWEEDENNALAEGVQKYGVGKWAQIKNWAGDRLEKRDTVAMKDRWRNMGRAMAE